MSLPVSSVLPTSSPAVTLPADTVRAAALQGSATRLRDAAGRAAALQAWAALSSGLDLRFFHTEAWLRGWLEQLPMDTPLWLLQATRDDRCVGLGFVARGAARRLGPLPFAPCWHLQGDGSALDAICVEYNDWLVDPAAGAGARAVLVDQWRRLGSGARELHLTNLAEPPVGHRWADLLQPAAPARPLAVLQHEKPSFSIDLQRVRDAGGDLLTLCSANLRSQVRRTLKAYGELGAVQLDVAPDTATALQWLDRLAALHQAHWQARGEPGAFVEPAFIAFHRGLVERCGVDPAAATHVQLLRLTAGAHEVGYLYNLVHGGRIHFYQSGLDFSIGGKHARPGYAAHVLAVALNARLGHAEYDFLMGESRYKRDLATDVRAMHTVVLQTGGWRFAGERLLRRLRDARRQAKAAAVASQPTASTPTADSP
jgi:CelD/BcsL family acetyltransferase involved in cellulose biosynthesis